MKNTKIPAESSADASCPPDKSVGYYNTLRQQKRETDNIVYVRIHTYVYRTYTFFRRRHIFIHTWMDHAPPRRAHKQKYKTKKKSPLGTTYGIGLTYIYDCTYVRIIRMNLYLHR